MNIKYYRRLGFGSALHPDLDPRFGLNPKTFFLLFQVKKNNNFMEKIKPLIWIRIDFKTLDPDQHEMDTDPKP